MEHSAFGGDGVFGVGAVQRANGGEDGGVACWVFGVECVLWAAGFERERPLPRRGSNFIHRETLVDVRGVLEAVETGGGEDERGALAGLPLAQASVDVTAEFDKFEVRAKSEKHGAAAWAGGTDAGAEGQHVQAPEIFADEGVAGVGARRDGGERKARRDLGGQVFERVHGEVDSPRCQGVFDLLDEDAGAVGRETFRCGNNWVL